MKTSLKTYNTAHWQLCLIHVYALTFSTVCWPVLSYQGKLISCVVFFSVRLSVIHNKDLLATIHLLVAMVRCFQPELDLPPNVEVEVVVVEVSLPIFWRHS